MESLLAVYVIKILLAIFILYMLYSMFVNIKQINAYLFQSNPMIEVKKAIIKGEDIEKIRNLLIETYIDRIINIPHYELNEKIEKEQITFQKIFDHLGIDHPDFKALNENRKKCNFR